MMKFTSTDVLIVGAGIAGISAACHLRKHCPVRDFQMVEARQAIGGTWDLFRYPGIRSDTDMHTYGFSFKPWPSDKVFGGAADIKSYLQETIDEYKLNERIHFGLRVSSISWSSADAQWTVILESMSNGELQTQTVTSKFVFMCSGYYDYKRGYLPDFPQVDSFQGVFVHTSIGLQI